jgi:hypothetical protein
MTSQDQASVRAVGTGWAGPGVRDGVKSLVDARCGAAVTDGNAATRSRRFDCQDDED